MDLERSVNRPITFIHLQFIQKTSFSSTLNYKQEIPLNYTPAVSVDWNDAREMFVVC